jgi:hypothetical protein
MTRKQIFFISALFLLAFLTGAVMNTPVVQLFHLITLPKQVAFQGLQGSVTNGKVDRVEVQGYLISSLEFHIQPACLLKLAICYQLSSDEDGMLFNLERSLLSQNTFITDSYVDLSNSVFDDIPNLLVKPAGDFRIEISQLQLNSNQKITDLNALLKWNNAGIQGESQVIGNYRAELSSTKEGISVVLSDQNSLLGLKGNVNLSWQGNYDSDLEFEHKAGLNPSLLSVLDMSARKSGLNRYKLKKKGVLPPNITNQLRRFSSQ